MLLLLQLHLGSGTDLDDAHATGQLRDALLELLAIPVGVGALDLGAKLGDAARDLGLLTSAVDDGGVVLGDDDAAGAAEHLEADLVQFETHLGGDDLAAGEDGDVLEHGLAAVTEGGGLDGHGGEGAADLVDHQRGQGLAVDILRHHEQGALGGDDLLQQREQVVHGGDLAGVDEDVGVLQDGFHAVGVRDEVRRQVALVELHALGELQLGAEGLGLVDGDDAVLADLVEGLGDQLTDLLVTRGDGGDVGHVGGGVNGTGVLVKPFDDGLNGLVDSALQPDRVGSGGHSAQALVDQRLGQHGGGGGAVAGDVVGLGSNLLGELGAEILVGILELDLLGDGHAVVGDGGGAPLLVEHDVAALGAEGHLDGVGEGVDAALKRTPRLLVELQSLCHGSRLDSAGDDGEDVARVEQQVVGAVVLDFGAPVLAEDDDITLGDVERDAVSLVVDATGAGGNDAALLRLLLGGVGDDQPGSGGLLGLERLDEDAVLERLDRGCHDKPLSVVVRREPDSVRCPVRASSRVPPGLAPGPTECQKKAIPPLALNQAECQESVGSGRLTAGSPRPAPAA